jgi:hypothetical protein
LTETQIIGQHDPQAVLEEFPVVRTKRRKKKGLKTIWIEFNEAKEI